MKIYLATADAQEIGWASECGFLDGVVASPAILARESEASGREPKDILTAICEPWTCPSARRSSR